MVLAISLMVMMSGGTSSQVEAKATVARPVADLYSRPSANSDVVTQAIYGTPVTVLKKEEGFTHIRTPDDYTGYIADSALRVHSPGERVYGSDVRNVFVESLFAHLYHEPNVTSRRPVLTVPYETRLELIDEVDDRWLTVRLVSGEQAWVQLGDVVFAPRVEDVDSVIAFSRRLLGLPYTWGGASAFGFDCSGFTQMLCRRRGVMIPRDARVQAQWEGSRAVSRDDLKPGDLLYFGDDPPRVTHTGMYLGNGEFIHSSTDRRPVVQISKLDDDPWVHRYIGARRLDTKPHKDE
jgi:gamma-D-glutamyl-L-lysine dipeptidyl-peptidase